MCSERTVLRHHYEYSGKNNVSFYTVAPNYSLLGNGNKNFNHPLTITKTASTILFPLAINDQSFIKFILSNFLLPTGYHAPIFQNYIDSEPTHNHRWYKYITLSTFTAPLVRLGKVQYQMFREQHSLIPLLTFETFFTPFFG